MPFSFEIRSRRVRERCFWFFWPRRVWYFLSPARISRISSLRVLSAGNRNWPCVLLSAQRPVHYVVRFWRVVCCFAEVERYSAWCWHRQCFPCWLDMLNDFRFAHSI